MQLLFLNVNEPRHGLMYQPPIIQKEQTNDFFFLIP